VRVLVLADFLFPEYLGGSARLATELNQALADAGVNLLCLSRPAAGNYASQWHATRPYPCLHTPSRQSGVLGLWRYACEWWRLWRTLRAQPWDVLLVHHFSLGLLGLTLRTRKRVYFFHGPVHLECQARGGRGVAVWLRRVLEGLNLKAAHRVDCLSTYMQGQLPASVQSKAVVYGPLHYQPVPVPLPYRPPQAQRLRLLTVRRLTPRTGVLELAALVAQCPQLELTVVGTGELLPTLKNQDYVNVQCTGAVDDPTLHALYAQHDLVILPSRTLEGFGLIILEALLKGTPVLASSQAGGGAQFLQGFAPDFIYPLDITPAAFVAQCHAALQAYAQPDIRTALQAALQAAHMGRYVQGLNIL
jgi:glycosyltransferase involved in cell wall biosynthesis